MLNCAICQNHCCGKSAILPPILLPFELNQFNDDDIYTENGNIFRLRKSSVTGFCKFLDDHQRCTIYERRPLECRFYPWIMQYDFTKSTVYLQLHSSCPQNDLAPEPSISLRGKVDEDFWKNFMKENV